MTSLTNNTWHRTVTSFTADDASKNSRTVENVYRADLVDAAEQVGPGSRSIRWQPETLVVTNEVVTDKDGTEDRIRVRLLGHRVKVDGNLSKVEAEDYWYVINGLARVHYVPTWVRRLVQELSGLTFGTVAHEPRDAKQVEYPGGKDGMWRASCSCGYRTTFCDTAAEASASPDQHIAAMTS